MKKNTKYLIILLALLLFTSGAIFLLSRFPTNSEGDVSSGSSLSAAESALAAILDYSDEEIAEIRIKNSENAFVLLPLSDAPSVSRADVNASSNAAEIGFAVAGLEKHAMTSDISTVARSLYQITPTKSLGDLENKEEFGLDGDGEAKVELKLKDGQMKSYVIGSVPGESVGRYLLYDKNIYIVSTLPEKVFGGPNAFLPTSIFSIKGKEVKDADGNVTGEEDHLEKLTLSGTNYPKSITIEAAKNTLSAYAVTAPLRADASSDKMTAIIQALKTVEATSVILPDYRQEDLAKYGLDAPAATASFILNGENHTISVSDEDSSGNCFLIVDDNPMIYEISADNVSVWSNSSLMQLRSAFIHLPNIMDVKQLSFSIGKTETIFSASRTLNEEKTTETNKAYDLQIRIGEKEISYDDIYQPMYKKLISLAVLSVDPVEYNRDQPVMKVKYAFFERSEIDEVAFYPLVGQDRYAAELNGEYTGIVKKVSVDEIIALVEKAGA